MFAPRNIAMIGASERAGSVGRALLDNLGLFGGRVFPINPKHKSVDGLEAFPHVGVVPEKVDVAVIATPASTVVRPIRPEDEPLMVKFHQTLSDRSVYLRYFAPLQLNQHIAHERLSRICFIDHDREMVLVAERRDPATREAEILAVARLSKLHESNEAEFALTVSDQWQGHGFGTQLLKLLVQVGRDEKLERITATMLHDNHEMQQVARKAGFKVEHTHGGPDYHAELVLQRDATSTP